MEKCGASSTGRLTLSFRTSSKRIKKGKKKEQEKEREKRLEK
jgi:hypothetical protein